MSEANSADAARLREAFFRKTRRWVVIFYAVLAAAAVPVAAWAVSRDWALAVVGGVVGFAVSVTLFLLGTRIEMGARAARWLLVASVVAGVVAARLLDFADLSTGWETAALGAFAGFLVGMIVGILMMRRRLARDDDLILRQHRLGFDPANPWRWLRG